MLEPDPEAIDQITCGIATWIGDVSRRVFDGRGDYRESRSPPRTANIGVAPIRSIGEGHEHAAAVVFYPVHGQRHLERPEEEAGAAKSPRRGRARAAMGDLNLDR
jgi:hypothetical protein